MAEQDDEVMKSWLGKVIAAGPLLGLAWWMYSSLSALEAGTDESVYVWAPVGHLYRHLGFWPAVLFVPGLIVLLLLAALVQFVREERQFRAEVRAFREKRPDEPRR